MLLGPKPQPIRLEHLGLLERRGHASQRQPASIGLVDAEFGARLQDVRRHGSVLSQVGLSDFVDMDRHIGSVDRQHQVVLLENDMVGAETLDDLLKSQLDVGKPQQFLIGPEKFAGDLQRAAAHGPRAESPNLLGGPVIHTWNNVAGLEVQWPHRVSFINCSAHHRNNQHLPGSRVFDRVRRSVPKDREDFKRKIFRL